MDNTKIFSIGQPMDSAQPIVTNNSKNQPIHKYPAKQINMVDDLLTTVHCPKDTSIR